MATFYHLDQSDESLRVGQILDLVPLPLGGRTAQECEERRRLYPGGVSRFGLGVLHDPPIKWTTETLKRENEAERVRRTHFPNLPSRCVSFFACESVEDIVRLQQHFLTVERPYPHGRIWKLDGTAAFWGDMYWLDQYGISNGEEGFLLEYWSQQKSECPLIEYLLAFPIRVVDKISES